MEFLKYYFSLCVLKDILDIYRSF
uniref:Uncharacterized protein n=1 Tax=Anguilla anguilla TaxID=7936 RepID=A0A0E9TCR8_ANGAN